MPTPSAIRHQIDSVVGYLVEVGLADDQNFAVYRKVDSDHEEITFHNARQISVALKDRAYSDIYIHLAQERAYNAKMPDGALIQMMYAFAGGALQQHRLAFFPAPHLEQFQNNPDIYREDEIYADVIARNIVPFPLRFDYDARADVHQELVHPKSHLTLGQYENCRIPVTAPLTPFWFTDFVLRNFYHTAYQRYAERLPRCAGLFEESILTAERGVIHVAIPTA